MSFDTTIKTDLQQLKQIYNNMHMKFLDLEAKLSYNS